MPSGARTSSWPGPPGPTSAAVAVAVAEIRLIAYTDLGFDPVKASRASSNLTRDADVYTNLGASTLESTTSGGVSMKSFQWADSDFEVQFWNRPDRSFELTQMLVHSLTSNQNFQLHQTFPLLLCSGTVKHLGLSRCTATCSRA